MTPQEAIIRIRKHNEVHSRKEPYAVHITEALQMAVEALEKQQWISVKDRLPEKEGTYIVHGNLGGVFGLFYDDMLSNSFKQMVTHWMPLPQPPKGE